jgi:hypothetical protein
MQGQTFLKLLSILEFSSSVFHLEKKTCDVTQSLDGNFLFFTFQIFVYQRSLEQVVITLPTLFNQLQQYPRFFL